jgi:hypothetical protein
LDEPYQPTPSPHFTIEPCKYIDDKIAECDLKTDLKIIALTTAFNKAESTLNIRLESMNEFRQQLADQAGQFVTRKEAELAVDNAKNEMGARITTLQYLVVALILAFIGAFIKSLV